MKKFVQLRLLAVLAFALFFAMSLTAQEVSKQVVYVWTANKADDNNGVHPSQVIVEMIETQLNYTVTVLPKTNIADYTEDDMAMLQNADLVILDRGIGSFNWNNVDNRVKWNTVTTPILSMNMYATRWGNLGWFETNDVVGYGSAVDAIEATVLKPEDPIFEGVTLDADNMFAIWQGSTPELLEVDIDDPDSGEHVIILERPGADLPLTIMTRFAANVPFSAQAGALTPPAPRTHFAMGRDAGGQFPYNYFNYTEDGKKVFMAEVKRMAELGGTDPGTNVNAPAQLSARIFPNPASNNLFVQMNNLKKAEVWDLTGKLVYSAAANGFEVKFDISALNQGIYLVKAIDSSNNVVVRKIAKNR
jgi:hypothetical protein